VECVRYTVVASFYVTRELANGKHIKQIVQQVEVQVKLYQTKVTPASVTAQTFC